MSPAKSALTVEFLGLPGVGKSSIAARTAQRLRAQGLSVRELGEDFRHSRWPSRRRAQKLICLGRQFLRKPRNACRAWRAIAATRQRSARDLIKNTVNWFYLREALRSGSGDLAVTIVDQGLAQAMWSIYLTSRSLTRFGLEAELREWFSEPTTFVLVSAKTESVARRLAERPGRASRTEKYAHPAYSLGHGTKVLGDVRSLLEDLCEEDDRFDLVEVDNDQENDIEAVTGPIVELIMTRAGHFKPKRLE